MPLTIIVSDRFIYQCTKGSIAEMESKDNFSIGQLFPTRSDGALQGTCRNVWTHFGLSLMEETKECYWN